MTKQIQSAIRRLLAQIDAERDAAYQALHGMAAGTTRHTFISSRMERIGEVADYLKEVVGEQEAMHLVIEHLESAPPQNMKKNESS